MIEFWLSLIIAILTGTVTVSEASSMTSEDTNPSTSIVIEWPCTNFEGYDVEYCYIYSHDDIVETGP